MGGEKSTNRASSSSWSAQQTSRSAGSHTEKKEGSSKRFLLRSEAVSAGELAQTHQDEQNVAPNPLRDKPLNSTQVDRAFFFLPHGGKSLGSVVLTLGCVPARLCIHGQTSYGDSTYKPKTGHVWDPKRVTLRPGLHQQSTGAHASEPGSTDDGWTRVTGKRGRRVKSQVPNHSSEDVNVFARCSEVDQTGNPEYSNNPRPAIVVGVGTRTVTLVALTSFSGEGLKRADRFTKLVASPVSGAAGPHETFDYDGNGKRVPIVIEPIDLGPIRRCYKNDKEVNGWILVGVPWVVETNKVIPAEGYSNVSAEALRILREKILAHTSPALAQQMNFGPALPSLTT